MVTIRYDAGEGEPAELSPMDNAFEYLPETGHWAVKVDETGDDEVVKWIPRERVYELRGVRGRMQQARP